eukprot:TRINITY_DN16155_c0_g2_i4.p1 TRINITY_DN16155_c0_g2~~TRINITY_DN16155_c0_g2_i4.p1  ORF type:complete len:459 (+),score=101.15 TRINITY_DN16155_c0_g2_i4:285-1661(+)
MIEVESKEEDDRRVHKKEAEEFKPSKSKRRNKKPLKLRRKRDRKLIIDYNAVNKLQNYLKSASKNEPLRIAQRRKPIFGLENPQDLYELRAIVAGNRVRKYRQRQNNAIAKIVDRKVRRAINKANYLKPANAFPDDPYMLNHYQTTPASSSSNEWESADSSASQKVSLSRYIRSLIEEGMEKKGRQRANSAVVRARESVPAKTVANLSVDARFPKVFFSKELVDKCLVTHRLGRNLRGRRLRSSLGQYSLDNLKKGAQKLAKTLKQQCRRRIYNVYWRRKVNSIRSRLFRVKLNKWITNELKLRHHCSNLLKEMREKYGRHVIRSQMPLESVNTLKPSLTDPDFCTPAKDQRTKLKLSKDIKLLLDKAMHDAEAQKPACILWDVKICCIGKANSKVDPIESAKKVISKSFSKYREMLEKSKEYDRRVAHDLDSIIAHLKRETKDASEEVDLSMMCRKE